MSPKGILTIRLPHESVLDHNKKVWWKVFPVVCVVRTFVARFDPFSEVKTLVLSAGHPGPQLW